MHHYTDDLYRIRPTDCGWKLPTRECLWTFHDCNEPSSNDNSKTSINNEQGVEDRSYTHNYHRLAEVLLIQNSVTTGQQQNPGHTMDHGLLRIQAHLGDPPTRLVQSVSIGITNHHRNRGHPRRQRRRPNPNQNPVHCSTDAVRIVVRST